MNSSKNLKQALSSIVKENSSRTQYVPFDTGKISTYSFCIICFIEMTTNVSTACLNPEYQCQYCKECFCKSILLTLQESRYRITSIKCCLCLQRIPTENWKNELLLMNTCESNEALVTFTRNINSILQIRCINCDSTCYFFEENIELSWPYQSKKDYIQGMLEVFVVREKKDIKRKLADNKIVGVYSRNAVENVIIAWGMMLRFEISTREFVSCIVDNCNDVEIFGKLDKGLQVGMSSYLVSIMLEKITNLIYDEEIRARLQLSTMQRFPKIFTICCCYAHCFNCQMSGHHIGKSCREISRELVLDAQYCPECEVAVIKIDGCDSIRCVCGCEWQWQLSDSEEDSNEDYSRNHYATNQDDDDAENTVDERLSENSHDVTELPKYDKLIGPCKCKICASNKASASRELCAPIEESINVKVCEINKMLESDDTE